MTVKFISQKELSETSGADKPNVFCILTFVFCKSFVGIKATFE